MRTKTLLSAVAILAGGIACSEAQVYSQNVVGYVNTTVTGNSKYTCINNPLNAPTNTIGVLLAGLPAQSQVLKYDSSISDYVPYTKTTFPPFWTGGGATVSLAPGEGCLVLMPAASSDATVTFVGEVLQGNLTNHFAGGFKMVGSMVPDSGAVSALGLVPPTGSQLLKWSPALQDWDAFTKVPFGSGWSHNPDNAAPVINVGEGFLLNANGSYDWTRSFTVN